MSGILKFISLILVGICLVVIAPVIAQETTPEPAPQQGFFNNLELPDFSIHEEPVLTNVFDTQSPKAPVVLDGRAIFEVGEFRDGENSVTANQRASGIERQLEDAVRENRSPQLSIEKVNGLPTISLNGSYLFTVTQKETSDLITVEEQAINLTQKIRNSILEGQKERQESYQFRQYVIAAIMIALAITLTRILNLLQVYSWSKALVKLFRFRQTNQAIDEAKINFFPKLVVSIGKLAVWLSAVYWVLDLFPQSRQVRYQIISQIWDSLNRPLFNNYSIVSILIFGLFLWA